MIGGRVAHRVEELPTAVGMSPPLGVQPLDVVAHVQEPGPFLRVGSGRLCGARYVGLSAMRELELRTLATIGACNEQHEISQWATAAAAASSIRLPSAKRSIVKGALIGCGSSRAMVCAKTCAEPGVALNPPVPQPQFTYSPGTGVLATIGERSGVTSTMPPQLRSMRSLRKAGKSSQTASSAWLLMCSPPRCV